MIDCQSLVQETYYEILSVDENASYEEIRASYRTAILKSHPDKIRSTELILNSDPKLKYTFHKIQKAWEILSCPNSRAIYDADLKTARRELLMADDIHIEDMIAQDDGEALSFQYQCHCGDYVSIDLFELESMGYIVKRENNKVSFSNGIHTSIILPCPSCSLTIRLLVDSGSRLIIDD